MKNKKMLAKIIFVIVLILIIIYTFRGSAGSIISEIRQTSLQILILICFSSFAYHLFEAFITYMLARRYNPEFRYRSAVHCAFRCSFYRLSTLGSGTGVAAIVFLGRHGIEYSEAIGLYMIQYVVHKVSVAVFSGIFFLLNFHFMVVNYEKYGIYLIAAYAITVVICFFLILFVVSSHFHQLILWLGHKFNRSGKFDDALLKFETNCQIMEKSTAELMKDGKLLIIMIAVNLVKLVFWYSIPFLIVMSEGHITLLDSLSVSSLSVMTAAVVPTPAGIGAVEFIMASLFGVILGMNKAGAVTILYRIATFIFPFIAGTAVILCFRFLSKRKRHGMTDSLDDVLDDA